MVTTSENRDLNSISEIEKAEAFCYQNFQNAALTCESGS